METRVAAVAATVSCPQRVELVGVELLNLVLEAASLGHAWVRGSDGSDGDGVDGGAEKESQRGNCKGSLASSASASNGRRSGSVFWFLITELSCLAFSLFGDLAS